MRHACTAAVLMLTFMAACSETGTEISSIEISGGTLPEQAALEAEWEATGVLDYTIRYLVRATVKDAFRVVEVAVVDGETISCVLEGDWDDFGPLDGSPCVDPPAEPVSFMFSVVDAVNTDYLRVKMNDDWHYPERLEYDAPDRSGEERLITVLRFEPITPQQQLWEALRVDDYRIVYEIHNMNGMGGSLGDGRFDVTVRGGRVAECTIENGWQGKQGPCHEPVPDPVDRIFAMLEAFNRDATEVIYHDEWHFPEFIHFDEPYTVDEEYRLRVLEFAPLVGG